MIIPPAPLIGGFIEARNEPSPTVELVVIKRAQVVRAVREDGQPLVGLSNTVVKLSKEIDARFSQDLPATVLLAVLPSALIENCRGGHQLEDELREIVRTLLLFLKFCIGLSVLTFLACLSLT